MPNLNETIRLVELTCARLCHDLGGLIGAVDNALEMMPEARAEESQAFAATAAKALSQRLRLMRAAWGPDAEPMTIRDLSGLAAPALSARRIGLDTRMVASDAVFRPADARVILNLIILAADSLPHGGTIIAMGEPGDLFVKLSGPGARWPAGLVSCLRDEAAALAALTSAASVQAPLTSLLAIRLNIRLSPVLGPTGIEALRMGGV